jgi:hypothetical protein
MAKASKRPAPSSRWGVPGVLELFRTNRAVGHSVADVVEGFRDLLRERGYIDTATEECGQIDDTRASPAGTGVFEREHW